MLEVGVVAEDDANVGQCIFDTAGPIQLQLVLPVLVGELGAHGRAAACISPANLLPSSYRASSLLLKYP